MKSKLHLHNNENNPESQKHLEENAQGFSENCLKVLELLNQGKRLTTDNAPKYGIRSLPRRIKDLRDRNGVVNIKDQWIRNEDGVKIKEWWIEITTRPTKKQVTEKVKKDLNDNPKWVQPDLL